MASRILAVMPTLRAARPDVHALRLRRSAELALAGLALLLLTVGAGVYLLDRAPGSAMLLPAAWQHGAALGPGSDGGSWFGAIGGWLPSFVHSFAFGLLTALLLPRRIGAAAAACGGWALVDSLAELGQHAALSPALVAAIEQVFGTGPLASALGRYFARGAFDLADLVAGLAGAALAFVALTALTALMPLPPAALPHASAAGKNLSSEEMT